MVLTGLICGHALAQRVAERPSDAGIVDRVSNCRKNVASPLPLAEIWIDDSASMQGFLSEGSQYERLFREMPAALRDHGFKAGYRALSSGLPVDAQYLQLAALYGHFNNHAFERIAAGGERPAEQVVIIVTDLAGPMSVPASHGGLDTIVRSNTEAVFYGIRSPFRDRFRNVGVYERPFYVIVLAQSRSVLSQFIRAYPIERAFPDAKTWDLSNPVRVRNLELVAESESGGQLMPFESPRQVPCLGGEFVEIWPFIESTGNTSKRHVSFALTADATSAIAVPSRYQATVNWLNRDVPTTADSGGVSVDIQGEIGAPSCTVTYDLPTGPAGEWDLYAVSVIAGADNIFPPVWIRLWSTDAGAGSTDLGKTPGLDGFAKELLRLTAPGQKVFLRHVIEVYRHVPVRRWPLFWLAHQADRDPRRMTFLRWEGFLDEFQLYFYVVTLGMIVVGGVYEVVRRMTRDPGTHLRLKWVAGAVAAAFMLQFWTYVALYRYRFPDTPFTSVGQALVVALWGATLVAVAFPVCSLVSIVLFDMSGDGGSSSGSGR